MTFDGLIDRLTKLFDVTQTHAVDVANEKLSDMVTRSTALRAVTSLGVTVADQASYPLAANIARILKAEAQYTAGTVEYDGDATIEDLWDVAAGDSDITGNVIAIEADDDTSMNTDNFRIYPAPGEDGIDVIGLVALRPATITYGSSTALPIPADHHQRLLAGCKAELYEEEGRQDLAASEAVEFEAGIKLLEASVTRRGQASRGGRLRVSRYDFNRVRA